MITNNGGNAAYPLPRGDEDCAGEADPGDAAAAAPAAGCRPRGGSPLRGVPASASLKTPAAAICVGDSRRGRQQSDGMVLSRLEPSRAVGVGNPNRSSRTEGCAPSAFSPRGHRACPCTDRATPPPYPRRFPVTLYSFLAFRGERTISPGHMTKSRAICPYLADFRTPVRNGTPFPGNLIFDAR
eukprot:gene10586-biopygen22827